MKKAPHTHKHLSFTKSIRIQGAIPLLGQLALEGDSFVPASGMRNEQNQ